MVETTDADGWTVTDEIGGIDSGDTHDFDPAKSCIAVNPGIVVLGKTSVCHASGEPAPLSFAVEIWEKGVFGFPSGFCLRPPPAEGRHAGPHCGDDGNGDDFIGRAQIDLPTQDLEAALPRVGDEFIETVVLSPCEGAVRAAAGICPTTASPTASRACPTFAPTFSRSSRRRCSEAASARGRRRSSMVCEPCVRPSRARPSRSPARLVPGIDALPTTRPGSAPPAPSALPAPAPCAARSGRRRRPRGAAARAGGHAAPSASRPVCWPAEW